MNVTKDWGSSWHLIENSINETLEIELNKKCSVLEKVDDLTFQSPLTGYVMHQQV